MQIYEYAAVATHCTHIENMAGELFNATRHQHLIVLARAIKIQVKPMGQFDLKAHPNEIGTLLIGYIDDKSTCQIVQNIGRYRMILFNSIRIGIHCGS